MSDFDTRFLYGNDATRRAMVRAYINATNTDKVITGVLEKIIKEIPETSEKLLDSVTSSLITPDDETMDPAECYLLEIATKLGDVIVVKLVDLLDAAFAFKDEVASPSFPLTTLVDSPEELVHAGLRALLSIAAHQTPPYFIPKMFFFAAEHKQYEAFMKLISGKDVDGVPTGDFLPSNFIEALMGFAVSYRAADLLFPFQDE